MAGGKEDMLSPDACTPFLNLQSRPILSYTLSVLEQNPGIEHLMVSAPRDRLEQTVAIIQHYGCHKVRKVVPSGANGMASVVAMLPYLDANVTTLVMHEASRPGLLPADMQEVIKAAKRNPLVRLGAPIDECCAMAAKNGVADEWMAAGTVWRYGYPMAFSRELLDKAMAVAKKKRKNPKTLEELWDLVQAEPRLVEASAFPDRIRSISQLQVMERAGFAQT
jgi:2-C-methyl-D-erythritol 4-phosphate cytidylyltransferase